TLVGVAETYFVSFLGTEALAGVSLVFPIFMLMQMMSNGGIGGGVASSIARAMGAGKVAEAEALALNALVLAIVFGVIFAGAEWRLGSLSPAGRHGSRARGRRLLSRRRDCVDRLHAFRQNLVALAVRRYAHQAAAARRYPSRRRIVGHRHHPGQFDGGAGH